MKTNKIKTICLLTAILLSAICLISSCSDDDNDEFSIIGKWNVDRVTDIGKIDGEVDSHNIYLNVGTITFEGDGSGIIKESADGFTDEFRWTLRSNELIFTWVGGSDDGFTTVYKLEIISPRKIELESTEIHGNLELIEIMELTKI